MLVVNGGEGEPPREYRGSYETVLGTHLVLEKRDSDAPAGAALASAGKADGKASAPGEKRPRVEASAIAADVDIRALVTKTLRFK